MGQGGGQQRHTSAVSSEKWWDSVAAYGAEMRVIATFFGLYAPDALPSYISVFSHDFKRFERCTKLATSSYCWPTYFKVLEVLFLEEGSSALLPSQKACGTPRFR